MSFFFKRKIEHVTLLETYDDDHNYNHNVEEPTDEEDDGSLRSSESTEDDTTPEMPSIPEEDPTTDPPKQKEEHRVRKKKSFLKTIRNIIFLKKLRSKPWKRKHSVYDELDEDFGELDEAEFEVVVVEAVGTEEECESLERVMGNGKKYKVDKSANDRMTSKTRKGDKKTVTLKPGGVQKKKSTKKKVLKATKSTGKFIGRGVIYTGSAFQYLAPVAHAPPERTWKKWHERPLRPYRQSEYVFV